MLKASNIQSRVACISVTEKIRCCLVKPDGGSGVRAQILTYMLKTLWVTRLCHDSALKPDSLPIFSGIRAAGIAVSATHDDLTAAKKPGFFVRSYVMATTR